MYTYRTTLPSLASYLSDPPPCSPYPTLPYPSPRSHHTTSHDTTRTESAVSPSAPMTRDTRVCCAIQRLPHTPGDSLIMPRMPNGRMHVDMSERPSAWCGVVWCWVVLVAYACQLTPSIYPTYFAVGLRRVGWGVDESTGSWFGFCVCFCFGQVEGGERCLSRTRVCRWFGPSCVCVSLASS
jgi:hypothetical protein